MIYVENERRNEKLFKYFRVIKFIGRCGDRIHWWKETQQTEQRTFSLNNAPKPTESNSNAQKPTLHRMWVCVLYARERDFDFAPRILSLRYSVYTYMCVPRALSLSRNVLASVMCITAACASFTRFIRYWENKNSSWLSSYQLRENTRDRSYLGDQCLALNAYETIWKDHETGIWMNFHEQWNILLDTQKPDDNYSS